MNFRERLEAGEPIILDGGMGSLLIAKGLARGTPPELWNLERRADVVDVHRQYVEAGSDAIQTNTFGGNPIRLEAYGLASRCEEVNSAAVSLAREAGPPFVVGDIGPTGEYLPPVGRGDVEAWREAFERQARALLEAGVDALHIETMSDLKEARVALEAIRAMTPSIPVMASMTFERKKRGFFTVMGNPLVESLASLLDAGADVVGANCSITSAEMRLLAEELLSGIDRPVVFQPNAGNPEQVSDGSFVYRQSPEDFAEDMVAIWNLGASVVGGCCGTDPRFISALKRRMEAKP